MLHTLSRSHRTVLIVSFVVLVLIAFAFISMLELSYWGQKDVAQDTTPTTTVAAPELPSFTNEQAQERLRSVEFESGIGENTPEMISRLESAGPTPEVDEVLVERLQTADN